MTDACNDADSVWLHSSALGWTQSYWCHHSKSTCGPNAMSGQIPSAGAWYHALTPWQNVHVHLKANQSQDSWMGLCLLSCQSESKNLTCQFWPWMHWLDYKPKRKTGLRVRWQDICAQINIMCTVKGSAMAAHAACIHLRVCCQAGNAAAKGLACF